MNETDLKTLDEVFSHYPKSANQLIPVLQEAQEKFGYLPIEVMEKIARYLHVPESSVYGVATFYAQFKFVPMGRNQVRVCRGTACHVRGSANVLEEVEKRLGIKAGETSSDLEYSIETIACFGSCALAPVMVINKDVYGRMTVKKVEQVLSEDRQRQ